MGRKIKLNMEGVETFNRCPEGEWIAKLKSVEMGEIQGSGDDCLKAQFEVIKGEAKGCTVFETFSLSEKALWKLKSCLQALGVKSEGKFVLDLDKLEGKVCVIDVIHDEYNGQKRAKIASYLKPEDDEEDEEEDEDEEEEAPRKPAKKAPAKPVKKSAPVEDDDDDEDEDEDEEEEEPKPKKTSKKAPPAKKAPTKTKKKVEEDEDDDDDWEDDDD